MFTTASTDENMFKKSSNSFKCYSDTRGNTGRRVLPNDGAHVPGQVASAGCGAEVFLWVQPVRVDHKVAIRQVAAA